jgi:hypothetical protein
MWEKVVCIKRCQVTKSSFIEVGQICDAKTYEGGRIWVKFKDFNGYERAWTGCLKREDFISISDWRDERLLQIFE